MVDESEVVVVEVVVVMVVVMVVVVVAKIRNKLVNLSFLLL